MATANNTIKTRIQLKSDTEANWNKAGPKENSNGFVPLNGELIIYSADNAHPFSRLKVGDGVTNVVNLPFIDAGTINGANFDGEVIVERETFAGFPSPGQSDKLYIDLSTNRIYCFTNSSGYTQLSNFDYEVDTTNIPKITNWNVGTLTEASIENNTLRIRKGSLPQLNYYNVPVVIGIHKVVNVE